jgi:dolichol-phosphate mannosyltransferase
MLNLCLVMPVYNEYECIGQVIADWDNEFQKHFTTDQYRMVVVNDGSKDSTPQILDQLATQYPALVVVHQPNGGHGQAVYNGYKKAIELGAEFVFQTDSDDQFVATDFSLLWQRRQESDFILAQRKIRHDAFVRLVITRLVIFLNMCLFFRYIPDSNIPYRLMRGNYLEKLMQRMRFVPFIPNIFLSILAARENTPLLNIPVQHKERATGTVSILRWKLVKVCFLCAKQLVQLRFS